MPITSFAWGLAPSEAHPDQAPGGCSVSDEAWNSGVLSCATGDADDALVSSCTVEANGLQVPQLLISDLVVGVALRLLGDSGRTIKPPRFTVHKTIVSPEDPPHAWLVTLTACFPCDGTPVTRCANLTVILDAVHVERSRVLSASDAGIVPAEQALMDGVLPYNALSAELVVKS